MFSKETLEHIGNSAIAATGAVQNHLPENVVAVPCGIITEDVQHLTPFRRRFTGKLLTGDIGDFITYVKDNASDAEKPQGFIDGDNLACTTFFNLGDTGAPGHADWKATLKLEQTSAYKAIRTINGRKHDQQELASWLEDWADNLKPFARDGGQPFDNISRAVAAIRHIKITSKGESESRVSDFGVQRSAMEEIEAKSALELPAGFMFTCEPYHGLPSRSFYLRLQVITNKDDPTLVLRIVQLEKQEEEIVRDFKALLLDHLVGSATMTIGTFSL